jgi:hypothetical protein
LSHFLTYPVIVLLLGLGFILFILCGIITLTIRISIRLNKLEPPKLWFLFAIAFLQLLLGGLTVYALRAIIDDPYIDLGIGLGMTFLSGLFFIKLILKNGWRRSLRVWAIAAAMQLVLVPICSAILVVGWLMLFFFLYPPLH